VGYVARNTEAAQKLDRHGLNAVPVSDMLDALDQLMSSNAVQVGAAEIDWKEILHRMFLRVPARLTELTGETAAEEERSTGSMRVRDIINADAAALPSLLEAYVRDHVARATKTSPAHIDTQQSLLRIGLDSLIAVEVRTRINADFGINVPLAKFMQGATINTLASYIAEQLRKVEGPKTAVFCTATASDGIAASSLNGV
jgi:acyl carrier protein